MDVIKVFCALDDFCRQCEASGSLPGVPAAPRSRQRASTLTLSEVMTIMVFFYGAPFRTFKHFYTWYVRGQLRWAFPAIPASWC